MKTITHDGHQFVVVPLSTGECEMQLGNASVHCASRLIGTDGRSKGCGASDEANGKPGCFDHGYKGYCIFLTPEFAQAHQLELAIHILEQ